MNRRKRSFGQTWALIVCLGLAASSTGCLQTNIGGQTLPSGYFLDDDVQYFPAGPETKLYNQVRALERYKVERQAMEAGVEEGNAKGK